MEKRNIIVVRNLLQEQEERGKGIRKGLYVVNIDKKRKCYKLKVLSQQKLLYASPPIWKLHSHSGIIF